MEDVIKIREAVVLCGGMGTRLRGVVSDVPKPLAPIEGEPFLSILLTLLAKQGIERVILAVGYMHEKIEQMYGNGFCGMQIAYSVEQTPLGTGGAVAKALRLAREKYVLVLNGDSVIKFELSEMESRFAEILKQKNKTAFGETETAFEQTETAFQTLLVLKRLENVDRYGSVVLNGERIVGFEEKKFKSRCLINAGVYVINSDIFSDKAEGEVFSFEKDFLERQTASGNLYGVVSEGFFIDIGVPEDYALAQKILKKELIG